MAIRPPEAGDPAVLDRTCTRVGEDPHDLALVFGVEAAHLSTQLDDRARGFLRLVPPEGLEARKRAQRDGRPPTPGQEVGENVGDTDEDDDVAE